MPKGYPTRVHGQWGVTVTDGKPQIGEGVDVTTRAGKTWTAYVSEIAGKRGRNWLVLTERTRRAALQHAERVLSSESYEPVEDTPAPPLGLSDQGDDLLLVLPEKQPENLHVLRGLPGARWDPATFGWRCSKKIEDRRRVLEICSIVRAPVQESIAQYKLPKHVTDAVKRAEKAGAFPYQLEGVEFLAIRTHAVLGDDMGLGKTFQTLQALPPDARTVVVCPNSLKRNWANEIERWRPDLSYRIMKGRGNLAVPEKGEIVLVNYEILPKEDKIKSLFDGTDFYLVADESHRVKNYRAQRSKRVRVLSDMASHIWFLTGTPLVNKPPDLYGMLDSGDMAREVFSSLTNFRKLFNAVKGQWGGWDFGMPDPSVPERLRRVMLRRTKSEVLTDLPAKQHNWIVLDVEDSGLLRKMDSALAVLDEINEKGYLPPFTRMSAVRADMAKARIPAMLEWVESREEEDVPVIVFSAHRAPIDTLADREGWGVITGDTPAEKRAQVVEDFQAGRLRGVGATIQAAGVGLTLTRASVVLFVNTSWSHADNVQAEDRVVRIGQTASNVQIYRMVFNHAMDLHVERILLEKQERMEKSVEAAMKSSAPVQILAEAESSEERKEVMDDVLANVRAELEALRSEEERELAHAKILERAGNIQVSTGGSRGNRLNVGVWLEKMPEEVLEKIHESSRALAASCDGAKERDGTGYNSSDTGVGRALAAIPRGDWPPEAYFVLYHILRKYKRQLGHLWYDIYED